MQINSRRIYLPLGSGESNVEEEGRVPNVGSQVEKMQTVNALLLISEKGRT